MSVLRVALGAMEQSFNGREISNVAELVMLSMFTRPELTAYLTVMEGITAKTQVGISRPLTKISKKLANCDAAAETATISIKQKFFNPQNIHTYVAQCFKELENSFFNWGLKMGVQRADLTGTQAEVFLLEHLRNAVLYDAQRIAWFGDTAVANLPAGKLKIGESVTNYDHYDGLWKDLFAIGTAVPAQVVTIPENAGATYALQNTLATDRAQGVFRTMVQDIDSRVYESTDSAPIIMCTKALFNNYKDSIRNKATDISIQKLMGGFEGVMFDGVQVIYNPLFDRTIADFDNGTRRDLPNRAVMYQKENLVIGIDALGSLSEFMTRYDILSNKQIIRSEYQADTLVLADEMVMMAY